MLLPDAVVAAVGVVVSVVDVGVLAVVLIAIVVGSVVVVVVLVAVVVVLMAVVVVVVVVVLVVVVVVVLMVGMVGLVETVVDSGLEFTSLLIVRRTNASIPRPRSAPRTRKRENGLNFHLLSCRVDTCPSLGGLTGWRKITTLVSFPFISATEPRKVLHLQFVRL